MGKDYQAFYKMYRNYTQGDAEVWAIHKVTQSGSIKQAILGTIGILTLLVISIGISYGFLIIPITLIGIGLYKRSPG